MVRQLENRLLREITHGETRTRTGDTTIFRRGAGMI